jgi:hypothetical protein
MKAFYLLVFIAVMLISFGGCKNKAKNSVTSHPEEFYNDTLPDELKNFASIEFVSQDDSIERITLFLKDPQKIDTAYPPLLKFSDEKSEWIYFSRSINVIGNDLGIAFNDSIGNERAILRMKKNVPAGFMLAENGQDKFYSVTRYSTFEIYEDEDEDNEYFDKVLDELEQTSSQVDKIPQTIKNLVPPNYGLYFCAMGDLNRDKYDDAIIIFGDRCCEYKSWILTGTSDNSYKISVMDDNIALGAGYFDDKRDFDQPFFDIVIKNGFFTIEHYRGVSGNNREISTDHFKYSKADDNWLLFRRDFVPNRFLAGNCCYDYHRITHFVEKILFEDYSSE